MTDDIVPYDLIVGLFNCVRQGSVEPQQTIGTTLGIVSENSAMSQETETDGKVFARPTINTPPASPGIGTPEAEDGTDDESYNNHDAIADYHLAYLSLPLARMSKELKKAGFYQPLPYGQRLADTSHFRARGQSSAS
jgi:hypothetical protein